MSDRVPRPQRVLPETAEARRADDALMRTIADAFQTAAAVANKTPRVPQHDIGSR